MLSSFSHKNSLTLLRKLRKAWEDAYIHTTILLSHGDINLLPRKIITQKQIDTELKSIAKELDKLGF